MEGNHDENPWGGNKKSQPKKLGGSGGRSGKLSRKVSEKFEKTKVVASTGVKKVKDGATDGVNWIKLKYHTHKTGQKK